MKEEEKVGLSQFSVKKKRKLPFKISYLVILIVASVGIGLFLISYALFTFQKEQKGALNIKTGNLTINMSIVDTNGYWSTNGIHDGPGGDNPCTQGKRSAMCQLYFQVNNPSPSITVTFKIENPNPVAVKILFGCDQNNTPADAVYYSTSNTVDIPSSAGVVLQPKGQSGSIKYYTMAIDYSSYLNYLGSTGDGGGTYNIMKFAVVVGLEKSSLTNQDLGNAIDEPAYAMNTIFSGTWTAAPKECFSVSGSSISISQQSLSTGNLTTPTCALYQKGGVVPSYRNKWNTGTFSKESGNANSSIPSIIIPRQIDGTVITRIDSYGFSAMYQMGSVSATSPCTDYDSNIDMSQFCWGGGIVIPDSVTFISPHAFWGGMYSHIKLPDSAYYDDDIVDNWTNKNPIQYFYHY